MRALQLPRPALHRAVAARLAAVAAFAVAPTLVAAQGTTQIAADVPAPMQPQASAAGTQRPADEVRTAAPAMRVVGEYAIRNPRRGFPQAFTVADSAGRLVAHYRTAQGQPAQPMRIAVVGTDLVLQAETAEGPIEVVLEKQNEPAQAGRATLSGRWRFRGFEGPLHGRVQP